METPKITVNEALIIAKEYHLENANRLFLYCKDTAILSFTLLLLNHTLQSVKIVVFLNRLLT